MSATSSRTAAMPNDAQQQAPSSPVVVSLSSLNADSLPLYTLTEAFGPTSLGIIVVKDLPPRFKALRLRLLQYASYLAHLPSEELARVTVPEAKYLTGWSHGVETLKSGKKDSLKGSWYTNCSFYHPRKASSNGTVEASLSNVNGNSKPETNGSHPAASNGSQKNDSNFNMPEYTSPNVWPSETILPGFQQTLEELCSLIIDVAVLVAKQCDRFAADAGIEGYEPGYLERVVSTSKTTKARLLHYFPPSEIGDPSLASSNADDSANNNDDEDDDWCTTHKDHGCLTGLTSALFVDESDPVPVLSPAVTAAVPDSSSGFELPPLKTLTASPDPRAGLYIRSRTGTLTKVAIPADCLAFQTGEALERVTRGKFAAVPHFVRGPRLGQGHQQQHRHTGGDSLPSAASNVAHVARNTLAVFTQPNLGEPVDDKGTTFAEFARQIVSQNTVG